MLSRCRYNFHPTFTSAITNLEVTLRCKMWLNMSPWMYLNCGASFNTLTGLGALCVVGGKRAESREAMRWVSAPLLWLDVIKHTTLCLLYLAVVLGWAGSPLICTYTEPSSKAPTVFCLRHYNNFNIQIASAAALERAGRLSCLSLFRCRRPGSTHNTHDRRSAQRKIHTQCWCSRSLCQLPLALDLFLCFHRHNLAGGESHGGIQKLLNFALRWRSYTAWPGLVRSDLLHATFWSNDASIRHWRIAAGPLQGGMFLLLLLLYQYISSEDLKNKTKSDEKLWKKFKTLNFYFVLPRSIIFIYNKKWCHRNDCLKFNKFCSAFNF